MRPATSHDHAARRHRLRERLADVDAVRLLVTDPDNVRYLTGFTGSNGQVVVGLDADEDRLVTDPRYEQRAAEEADDVETVLDDPVATALDGLREGALGVEAEHLSWAAAERVRDRAAADVSVVACSGLVETLRVVKDASEIACLERACAVTEQAMMWLFERLVVGRTERELATALERRFVDTGAEAAGFASIVASGPNGAVPHHAPGERRLRRGDLLTVDCGARVDGYHADCTRTVALGTAAGRLAEVHEVVLRAQRAGRHAVRVGARGDEVDAAARRVVGDAGLGAQFVHGTGHGVGLAIHERPAIARGAGDRLRAWTALTVEPGVYLPGVGGVRIEDTLVVTADDVARPLTDIPRELVVL